MSDGRSRRTWLAGWRGLGRFWALIAVVAGAGAVVLQALGPPLPAGPVAATAPPPEPAVPPAVPLDSKPATVITRAEQSVPPGNFPGRETPGPIADPDPGLLEPAPDSANDMLPRISPDGRKPMQVYAAGFDRGTMRARVGIVLAGIGMNEADSLEAARMLPGPVTLAVTPYAGDLRSILTAARLHGHELLVSLPMEPSGFALSDPGPKALMTDLPWQRNRERLYWALSRFSGYVGVTGALGEMRGERFAGMTDQFGSLMKELHHRGLLYISPQTSGAGPGDSWARAIDVVIDAPADAATIEQRLEELTKLARDRGAALGLATAPRPVTIDRLTAWANGLANRGLILAPVSALVLPPRGLEGAK